MNQQHTPQEILMLVQRRLAPLEWLIYQGSLRKSVIFVISFCVSMALLMGLLVFILVATPHLPIPSDAQRIIFVILCGWVLLTILLSLMIWVMMRDILLVVTPEGVVYGKRRKSKVQVSILYAHVAEMSFNDGWMRVRLKGQDSGFKNLSCRWLEAPAEEVATSVIEAYNAYKQRVGNRRELYMPTWNKGSAARTQLEHHILVTDSSSLLSEVNQIALSAHLGQFVRMYTTSVRQVRLSFQRSGLLFVLSGLAFLGSLCLLLSHPEWPRYLWFLPLVLLVAFVVFWLLTRVRWVLKRTLDRSVYLYEGGLLDVRRYQAEALCRVVLWEQVVAVWQHWGEGCLVYVTDEQKKGAVLHISNRLTEYQALAQSIQREITRRKAPQCLEDIQHGRVCSFERFLGLQQLDQGEERPVVAEGCVVTQGGLRYRKRFLPWQEVASVSIRGGYLLIVRQEQALVPWLKVRARLIGNVDVLVEVAASLLK